MRRAALAFAAAAAAAAAAAQPALVAEGEVRYACGGAGVEEREALGALERETNLKLVFVTQKRGGYLADVALTVQDAGGRERLRTLAPGPVCMLALPAGRYRLVAAYGGERRNAAVDVPAQTARPRTVVFAFPGEKWDGIWASEEEKAGARAGQRAAASR